MRITRSNLKRRAATTVEFAVVSPIIFLLLFGVIEWCRYIMVRNVTDNAVREGTRYALARTDTLQSNISVSSINTYVNNYLSKMGSQLSNVTITVYKTDMYGQPVDNSGTVVASSASAGAFDQTKFGDYICVNLVGDYKPVLPNFLYMTNLTKVYSTCIMCSEGN